MIEHYKNFSLKDIYYQNELGQPFTERWKDIPGYEGLYQVSDLGRVKSLEKSVIDSNKVLYIKKTKILKQANNGKDYLSVLLYDNKSNKKSHYIHRLVLKTFLEDKKLVVDHKNHIRLCNVLSNLRYLTPRLNSSTFVNKPEPISKYIGVSKTKYPNKKWKAVIRINGSKRYIGSYITEEEASDAYQKALHNWDNYSLNPKGEYEEKKKVEIFNTKKGENLGVNAKIVLDKQTGIFYDSLREACDTLSLKYKYTSSLLKKNRTNKTSLTYV